MVTLPELLCIWVFSTCAAETIVASNAWTRENPPIPTPITVKAPKKWNLQKYNQWMTAATKPTCCYLYNNCVFKMRLVVWWMNLRMISNPNPSYPHNPRLTLPVRSCKLLVRHQQRGKGRELFKARFKTEQMNAITIMYKSRDVYSTHDAWIHMIGTN